MKPISMLFLKVGNRILDRRKLLIRCAVLVCFWMSVAGVAREITDATKTKISITDRPQRVITLAPSLGELAADLVGANIERIVGVSEYSDYPPGLKKISS